MRWEKARLVGLLIRVVHRIGQDIAIAIVEEGPSMRKPQLLIMLSVNNG